MDIAAWKITEGARECVRRGRISRRKNEEEGGRRTAEGGSEDERDGRREKRRLAVDSTVTERDKGNEPNYPSFLSSSSFRFHPLFPRHKPLHPSRRFLYRETRNLSRYVGSEI